MLNKFLIALCVLLMGFTANAQSPKRVKKTVTTTTTEEVNEDGSLYNPNAEKKVETNNSAPEVDSGLPSQNESWYTLWGLGFSAAKYSSDVGDMFNTIKDQPGIDRNDLLNLDLLGFYWPLEGNNTMIGVIINGLSDKLTGPGGHFTVTTALLAFSTHHFFGKNIGDGWFVRGDVGLSRASVEIKTASTNLNKTSDPELGVMFGGGYAFPISQGTRLLVGLYVRPLPEMDIDGAKLKGTITNVTAGFLF
jgi:hypothetical protein